MTIIELLPLLFIAAATIIAPLLAGLPNDQTWTSLCLALVFGALTIRILASSTSAASGAEDKSKRTIWMGMAVFAGFEFLSLIARLIGAGTSKPNYIDVMLRGVAYWTGMIVFVKVTSDLVRDKMPRYAILLCTVFTAAIASTIGLQDYLVTTIRLHIRNWREFGTSTPDYFAAYLILTIPVTLGLFLGAAPGSKQRIIWLYGFALLLQLVVLPTTGSRFALVSLVFSIVVFGMLFLKARRNGLEVHASMRTRAAVLLVGFALGALAFGGSLIHRLSAGTMHQQANSGDFRVWTWKGSVKLAQAHPLLGCGPGMYVYDYPKYALVSFTRVAHDGYLQLIDEIGIIGVIGLVAALIAVIALGIKSLKIQPESIVASQDKALSTVEVTDERLVIAGLIAGVSGGLLQNLIDSDWYFTIFSVTLFILVGILYGMAVPIEAQRPQKGAQKLTALIPAAACVICLIWTAASASAGAGNYAKAVSLDPYCASYHSDYAWKTLIHAEDYQNAQAQLNQAIALGPDPVAYYRRGEFYDKTQRPQQALADFKSGLALDPNSLALLKQAADVSAQLGDQAGSLRYYQHMSDMETSPFGQVRAISDLVEYHYAYSDAALGIDAARRDDPAAISYLTRARDTLEAYADEGGSSNPMRSAETGEGGATLDQSLQSLYQSVMTTLVSVYQNQNQVTLAIQTYAREKAYLPRFVQGS